MIKILDRYIAWEVVTPFFMGVFIFTFVLLMFQILKLAEMVVNYGVALSEVALIIGYVLLPFLVFTVPMAFLLAVMLGINRLSADSELAAIKASGISLFRITPPVLVLAILASMLTFGLTLFAEPWGKASFKKLLFELGRKKATLGITEREFNTDFSDLVIFVNKVRPETNTLEGVFIADERNDDVHNIIIAKKGRFYSEKDSMRLVLQLENGSIHRRQETGEIYENAAFARYDVSLDFTEAMGGIDNKKSYLEMGLFELSAHVDKLRSENKDDFNTRRAWVEYHRRFAFPFACVVFAFIGIPLGISPPRSGRSRGFSVALGVMSSYYLMFRVGENLGWKGIVHPAVVMWAPNILLLTLGIWLLYKKANELPIKSLDFLMAQPIRIALFVKRKFSKSGVGEEGEK